MWFSMSTKPTNLKSFFPEKHFTGEQRTFNQVLRPADFCHQSLPKGNARRDRRGSTEAVHQCVRSLSEAEKYERERQLKLRILPD